MSHEFVRKKCIKCGLNRTKVDATTTDYGSRTSFQWRYFKDGETELNKNAGRCPL
jgi:hypothetical protein